jgi:aminoglycoside phosphotransferase (APT) family kinase protein
MIDEAAASAQLLARLNGWACDADMIGGPVAFERIVRAQGGASSETFFLTARGELPAKPIEWVLRVEPINNQVYQDCSIARQYGVITRLAREAGLPIPAPVVLVTDPSVIGAPFFLMEKASGMVPPREYHQEGLLVDLSVSQRHRLWHESVALLARLHAVDPADFEFLGYPNGASDPDGVVQELARWDCYREWSAVPELPVYDRARTWLEDFRPGFSTKGFAWGDARLANMLFADARPTALLDWETASLGGAETDLGWWLFYDRMISDAAGVPRLDGIGDASATVARWEDCSARKASNMEWHQVFAGFRFALISERARALSLAAGRLPAGEWGAANPAVSLLETMLDEHGA